jgi:hypothetical protein
MAIIHTPEVATVVFGGGAVLAGCDMVTTVYARMRLTATPSRFWTKIGVQSLIILGCLVTWALIVQSYYLDLPPDHSCISEYDNYGRRTVSWSLFNRACY